MSGQTRLTLWLAEQGSRTSRQALRHRSCGRRTLDAATAAPPNLCRGQRLECTLAVVLTS